MNFLKSCSPKINVNNLMSIFLDFFLWSIINLSTQKYVKYIFTVIFTVGKKGTNYPVTVSIWKTISQETTTKKNEILPFATTRMDFEGIMLIEVSHRKTNAVFLLIWSLKHRTNEYNKRETGL